MSRRAVPGLEPAPTNHAKLVEWVREIADLAEPDRVVWCDGSQAEWDRLTAELGAAGALKPVDPPNPPARRRPGREPHLHLLGRARGRRPDQQLARPGRDARGPARPLQGCD